MGSTPGNVSRRAFTLGAIGVLGAVSGCQSGEENGASSAAGGDAAAPSLGPVPTHNSDLRPLVEAVDLPPDLPETAPTLIRGARLFDGEQVTESADVILSGGLIAAVGSGLTPPDGAEEIDGTGHTLVPAMIDAHTHSGYPGFQPQSARFGVLTELDMFLVTDFQELRAEEASTGAPGRADVFSATSMATAPNGHGTQFRVPDFQTLTAVSEVPDWVQERVDEGASYVKIVVESNYDFSALDSEIVTALCDAAHEHGLRAIVHAQSSADLQVALASPIDGLAHVAWFDEVPQPLIERVVEMGLFVVTTSGPFQPTRLKSALDDDTVLDRVEPSLLPSFRRATYGSDENWARALANLTALVEAGAQVIAGTDCANPGTTAGAGMLVELENLVEAGLSPEEALAAATSRTADVFGLQDRGRIAEGLRADVLLVHGDPTTEITDLRATAGVWKWGVPVDLDLPEDDSSGR